MCQRGRDAAHLAAILSDRQGQRCLDRAWSLRKEKQHHPRRGDAFGRHGKQARWFEAKVS